MIIRCLLFVSLLFLINNAIFSQEKVSSGKTQGKSSAYVDKYFGPDKSGYPQPFNRFENPRTRPAVSTGYYFVDSHEWSPYYLDPYWYPFPNIEDTNYVTDGAWHKIQPGPRTTSYPNPDSAARYWARNPNGHAYFRNPAYPSAGNYFMHGEIYSTDSTDDAIAGPVPLAIKGGFIFNGIRYDSFYVSTNGIVALTNRRYLYDSDGNRKIGPHGDCYDRMSMDWFNPTGNRAKSNVGSALSLNDTIPDDFGYRYSVLHNNPSNPLGGIRARGGHLDSIFNNNYRSAVIAPFFGDLNLSQYDAKYKKIDKFGKVYYKTYNDSSKIVIYFINAAIVRSLALKPGTPEFEAPFDRRPGDTMVSVSGQVVLDGNDSTVSIQYEIFQGYINTKYSSTNGQSVFLYNTTCGVLGWARHVNNYKGKNAAYYQEYLQYTHYFSKYRNLKNYDYVSSGRAVRFKQWKNTLGVLSFYYRVRPLDKTKPLDYTESVPTSLVNNFEMLAEEERLCGVQPVVLIQNLSNDITQVDPTAPGSPNPADYPGTGLNSVRQDLKFRARFKIVNPFMNKILYNRLMPVDSAGIWLPDDYDAQQNYYGNPYCKVRNVTVMKNGENYVTTPVSPLPQGLNGIPPYGFAEVYFPPYDVFNVTYDKYKNITDVGKMKAIATSEATEPGTGIQIGDQWPGDDSLSANLFIMKRLTSLYDDFSDFYVNFRDVYKTNNTTYSSPAYAQPSPYEWVNLGSEIVKGENVSKHPLPPRRPVATKKSIFRNINSVYDNAEKFDYTSPCLNMNRIDLDGTDFTIDGQRGGDEIRSFPIDLRQRRNAILSLSIQRTNNSTSRNLSRGFSDSQLLGCEPRAILNGDPYQPFNTSERSAAFSADEICVEFAKPSPDQIHGITNIGLPLPYIEPEKRGTWRYHPRRAGAAPVTNMAAYTLYGAGGNMRGFLEWDKDSALTQITGLRTNIYDDGFDEDFQKIYLPIPDTFISAAYEGAKNFRFRIRVNARNDEKNNDTYPFPDDNDDFYVDNISLMFPCECGDIEAVSCGIVNPYMTIPPRQSAKIPVYVNVNNNTGTAAPSFFVKVKIYRGTKDTLYDMKPVYCRRVEMPFLSPGETVRVEMPEWDATLAGIKKGGPFFMVALIRIPGGDIFIENDTTFNEFTLNFGENFGYDTPTDEGQRDMSSVPFEAVGWSVYKFNKEYGLWKGLSLGGYNYGGIGNYNSIQEYDNDPYAFGSENGASGQIAMKFELIQPDTIKGIMAYFHSYGSSPDYINLSVYKDSAGLPHGKPIEGTLLEKKYRGYDDLRNDDTYYDEYITYLLKNPVVLPKGVYWASVAQLSLLGLGASSTRMGMRTTNVSIPPPINISREVGKYGNSLLLHKEFRIIENDSIKGNNNIFAYENNYNSGDWHPFMPTTGNPAYAHSHHFGASYADGYNTWTLTNGTWLPFIKPYFGPQEISSERKYEECADDIPVELTAFNARPLDGGISLYWETASEINNYGFYVDKRMPDESQEWKRITFVRGKGNSGNISRYNYLDTDVALNKTYQYRLFQADLDGSASCGSYSGIITVNHEGEAKLTLGQNYPNPFSESTMISFYLPEKCFVRLEILDLTGNIVCIPVNRLLESKAHEITWNRTLPDGAKASAGTYLIRLTAGEEVRIGKMTVE